MTNKQAAHRAKVERLTTAFLDVTGVWHVFADRLSAEPANDHGK